MVCELILSLLAIRVLIIGTNDKQFNEMSICFERLCFRLVDFSEVIDLQRNKIKNPVSFHRTSCEKWSSRRRVRMRNVRLWFVRMKSSTDPPTTGNIRDRGATRRILLPCAVHLPICPPAHLPTCPLATCSCCRYGNSSRSCSFHVYVQ